MKIKKLFYTDGDEKEGDIVRAYFPNIWGGGKAEQKEEYCEEGLVVNLGDLPVPVEGIDFYILLQRSAPSHCIAAEKIMLEEISDFCWLTDNGIIYEIEPGKYEFNHGFISLLDGAYPTSEEDPSVYGRGMHLKADDMDKRVQAMVDKYKNAD